MSVSALKKRLALQKAKKTEVPNYTKKFIVQKGWEDLLKKDMGESYLQGFHHFYEGIRLNKENEDDLILFGARDLVLSWLFANRDESKLASERVGSYLVDLFSDAISGRGDEKHKVAIYTYLKSGLKSTRDTFSASEPDLLKWLDKDLHFNRLKPIFGPDDVKTLVTEIIRIHKEDPLKWTDGIVDGMIYIYSVGMSNRPAGLDLEFAAMGLLMAVKHTGQVSEAQLERKITSFSMAKPGQKTIITRLIPDALRLVWQVIQSKLESGVLTTEVLIDNLYKITDALDNVVIKPLPDQIAYRNLTSIMTIVETISGIPDFPWDGLVEKNAIIAKEIDGLTEVLKAFDGDHYIGLVVSGCSKEFPNLAFLCMQLSIQLLGNESLKNYRGTGSQSTKGVNQAYYAALIKSYIEDKNSTLGGYADLKTVTSSNQGLVRLSKRVTDFMKGSTGGPPSSPGGSRPSSPPPPDTGSGGDDQGPGSPKPPPQTPDDLMDQDHDMDPGPSSKPSPRPFDDHQDDPPPKKTKKPKTPKGSSDLPELQHSKEAREFMGAAIHIDYKTCSIPVGNPTAEAMLRGVLDDPKRIIISLKFSSLRTVYAVPALVVHTKGQFNKFLSPTEGFALWDLGQQFNQDREPEFAKKLVEAVGISFKGNVTSSYVMDNVLLYCYANNPPFLTRAFVSS